MPRLNDIKARRMLFLNKRIRCSENRKLLDQGIFTEEVTLNSNSEDSFDKLFSNNESDLLNNNNFENKN
jgi:hypothetical protein